jgi:hypothetical protein
MALAQKATSMMETAKRIFMPINLIWVRKYVKHSSLKQELNK